MDRNQSKITSDKISHIASSLSIQLPTQTISSPNILRLPNHSCTS